MSALPSKAVPQYYVARQPICDRQLTLAGYELLYRQDAQTTNARFVDPEQATAQVFVTAMTEIGLDQLTGNVCGFFNMTHAALDSIEHLELPPERVVFEVLEDVEVTAPLLASLAQLAARGYQIALDDFVLDRRRIALLKYAHIVKLDVCALSEQALFQHIKLIRRFPVKLLAEKVETWDEFNRCKQLGFELFQGYFYARPQMLRGQKAPDHGLSILKLLATLNDPRVEFDQLEQLIARDPMIYYRLLRFIHSAHFGLKRQFSNIRSILIFLGLDQIRTLVSMLALTKLPDTPPLLLSTILQRAKHCELLCQEFTAAKDMAGDYFTLGLFSMIDVCLNVDKQRLFEHLPLKREIVQAIVDGEGQGGQALACSQRFEQGQCDLCEVCISSPEIIQQHYLQATAWADQSIQVLNAPPDRG